MHIHINVLRIFLVAQNQPRATSCERASAQALAGPKALERNQEQQLADIEQN